MPICNNACLDDKNAAPVQPHACINSKAHCYTSSDVALCVPIYNRSLQLIYGLQRFKSWIIIRSLVHCKQLHEPIIHAIDRRCRLSHDSYKCNHKSRVHARPKSPQYKCMRFVLLSGMVVCRSIVAGTRSLWSTCHTSCDKLNHIIKDQYWHS